MKEEPDVTDTHPTYFAADAVPAQEQPTRPAPVTGWRRPRRHDVLATLTAVATHRVVAIVRARDAESATSRTRALLDAGAGVVEVSLTTPNALEVIASVTASHRDGVLGAGTVLDAASAVAAIRAGARLLVTPTLNPEVIAAAGRYGAVVIPGCATPTEMLHAQELGAPAVKLFPARQWTPAALRDVLEALPQLNVVPTGGVDINTVPDWLAAGAFAVGIGSALTSAPPEQMHQHVLQLHAAAAVANGASAAAPDDVKGPTHD